LIFPYSTFSMSLDRFNSGCIHGWNVNIIECGVHPVLLCTLYRVTWLLVLQLNWIGSCYSAWSSLALILSTNLKVMISHRKSLILNRNF
jgi:hypothetical protein